MDRKRFQVLLLAAALAVAPMAAQAKDVNEKPGFGAMVGDLLIARPLGLVVFAVGTATFVATLPFSLLGGNTMEAGKTLMVKPAEEVFVRCLGCTRDGRKEKVHQ